MREAGCREGIGEMVLPFARRRRPTFRRPRTYILLILSLGFLSNILLQRPQGRARILSKGGGMGKRGDDGGDMRRGRKPPSPKQPPRIRHKEGKTVWKYTKPRLPDKNKKASKLKPSKWKFKDRKDKKDSLEYDEYDYTPETIAWERGGGRGSYLILYGNISNKWTRRRCYT